MNVYPHYCECVSVNPVCAPNSLSIKKFCLCLSVHMYFHTYIQVCAYVCTGAVHVYVHVDIGVGCQVTSSIVLHSSF